MPRSATGKSRPTVPDAGKGLSSRDMMDSVTLNARPRPTQELSAAEKLELRDVFNICDSDGSNALDWHELRTALRGRLVVGFSPCCLSKKGRYGGLL